MKTDNRKMYGVPAEAKKAENFIRVMVRKKNGEVICDTYQPLVKPKNPVSSFRLWKENGEWQMKEFRVCGSMTAAWTAVNSFNIMDADRKNAILTELFEDGAVMF